MLLCRVHSLSCRLVSTYRLALSLSPPRAPYHKRARVALLRSTRAFISAWPSPSKFGAYIYWRVTNCRALTQLAGRLEWPQSPERRVYRTGPSLLARVRFKFAKPISTSIIPNSYNQQPRRLGAGPRNVMCVIIASLARTQDYADAKPMFQRSLRSCEARLGAHHRLLARPAHDLGDPVEGQGASTRVTRSNAEHKLCNMA